MAYEYMSYHVCNAAGVPDRTNSRASDCVRNDPCVTVLSFIASSECGGQGGLLGKKGEKVKQNLRTHELWRII